MLGKVSNHNESETDKDSLRTGCKSIEEILVTISVTLGDGDKTKPTHTLRLPPINKDRTKLQTVEESRRPNIVKKRLNINIF